MKSSGYFTPTSFSVSRVRIDNPRRGFRLKTRGWGTFRLRAEGHLRSGQLIQLSKMLILPYPEDDAQHASPDNSKQMTLFLSHSFQESRTAAHVRKQFQDASYVVLDPSQVEIGVSWNEALRKMISKSDAVVGIIGDDQPTPFMVAEIEESVASGKPTIVLAAKDGNFTGIPKSVHRIIGDQQGSGISEAIKTLSKLRPS
jgi:hypothetical protein